MALADFIIKIGVDGRQGVAGINSVGNSLKALQSKLGQFGGALGGLGGAGALGGALGGLGGTIQAIASAAPGIAIASAAFSSLSFVLFNLFKQAHRANELGDIADKLDTSTEAVQRLQFSTKGAGGDFDQFVNAIGKLRRSQSEALTGNDKMVTSFEALGLSLKDLQAMSAEELFYKISQGAKDGNLNVANFASFINVLGKNAKELIPAMKDDIAGLAKAFDKLHLAIPQSMIQQLDDFDVVVLKIKAHLGAVAGSIKNLIASGTASVLTTMTSGAMMLGGFATGNPDMIRKGRDLKAQRDLVGDADYSASLTQSQVLQQKLDQRIAANRQKKHDEMVAAENVRKDQEDQLNSVRPGAYKSNADSYARMGLFVGGRDVASQGLSTAREANKLLKSIDNELKQIKRNNATE